MNIITDEVDYIDYINIEDLIDFIETIKNNLGEDEVKVGHIHYVTEEHKKLWRLK